MILLLVAEVKALCTLRARGGNTNAMQQRCATDVERFLLLVDFY